MADRTSGPPLRDPFEGTSYRALRRLGGGATGDVYAVEHTSISREFVAKVLHAHLASDARSADRLRLEAQALGRLSHPNVVSVQGFGETRDGRQFLVMERLRGHSLARELELCGSLPVGLAIAYATELLCALEAVHTSGLVHRNVTLGSVFLAKDAGGTARVKLIDFGLVRVLPDAPAGAPTALAIATQSGEVMGTPRFLSPEGALGHRVDEASDIYGAALVLYTMLAGRGPFDHAGSRGAMLAAHATEIPAPPSAYATEPVPAELDALLLNALQKNPRARPQSARALREHLERLTALLAQPTGWLETTQHADAAATPGDGARADAGALSEPLHSPSRNVRYRASPRALLVTVVIAISGLVASGMAVVAAAAILRGGR
jgi:serine/threonine-protein kinase